MLFLEEVTEVFRHGNPAKFARELRKQRKDEKNLRLDQQAKSNETSN